MKPLWLSPTRGFRLAHARRNECGTSPVSCLAGWEAGSRHHQTGVFAVSARKHMHSRPAVGPVTCSSLCPVHSCSARLQSSLRPDPSQVSVSDRKSLEDSPDSVSIFERIQQVQLSQLSDPSRPGALQGVPSGLSSSSSSALGQTLSSSLSCSTPSTSAFCRRTPSSSSSGTSSAPSPCSHLALPGDSASFDCRPSYDTHVLSDGSESESRRAASLNTSDQKRRQPAFPPKSDSRPRSELSCHVLVCMLADLGRSGVRTAEAWQPLLLLLLQALPRLSAQQVQQAATALSRAGCCVPVALQGLSEALYWKCEQKKGLPGDIVLFLDAMRRLRCVLLSTRRIARNTTHPVD